MTIRPIRVPPLNRLIGSRMTTRMLQQTESYVEPL